MLKNKNKSKYAFGEILNKKRTIKGNVLKQTAGTLASIISMCETLDWIPSIRRKTETFPLEPTPGPG